jgi:hypothetical protein
MGRRGCCDGMQGFLKSAFLERLQSNTLPEGPTSPDLVDPSTSRVESPGDLLSELARIARSVGARTFDPRPAGASAGARKPLPKQPAAALKQLLQDLMAAESSRDQEALRAVSFAATWRSPGDGRIILTTGPFATSLGGLVPKISGYHSLGQAAARAAPGDANGGWRESPYRSTLERETPPSRVRPSSASRATSGASRIPDRVSSIAESWLSPPRAS